MPTFICVPILRRIIACLGILAAFVGLCLLAGCSKRQPADEIVVYCGVDEPYASQIFADFEKQTGLHVAARYDVESSKSVGLAGRLEAEKGHPQADVWWGNEAFLSGRLASAGVLTPYQSPAAADIPDQFKDADGYWTGTGLRARVLAVRNPPPSFEITGIEDLADPRLKGKVVMSRPTSGASVAHVAALYTLWGPEKARAFYQRLYANNIVLVGGNAEVANQVGAGNFVLGLTDNDDITDAAGNGAKLTTVVPDQGVAGQGTLAMPTTVALVKGGKHVQSARKLLDFLVSREGERRLIDLKFCRWSVRGAGSDGQIKAMKVDYRQAVEIAPRAQREATAILEGRGL